MAELLGLDKQGGAQRIQNWLVRGIPAQVKVDFPSIFMPELAAATATIAQAATETVAIEPIQTTNTGALRAGAVRRHANRRAEEDAERGRRAKGGPPFQGVDVGVA